MVCKVCGRTITNEEANFCEYCGASFRPGSENIIKETILSHAQESVNSQMSNEEKMEQIRAASLNRTISFGEWAITYLLLLVPYVNIGLMIYWSFGKSVPVSKKNWARVMILVMVLVVMLLGTMFVSSGGTAFTDPTAFLNGIYGK